MRGAPTIGPFNVEPTSDEVLHLARSTIESQQRALDEAAAALSDALKRCEALTKVLRQNTNMLASTQLVLTDVESRKMIREAMADAEKVLSGDARLVGSAAA